jgi:hypothetical protein
VFVPKGSDNMVDKNEIVVSYSITWNWDGPWPWKLLTIVNTGGYWYNKVAQLCSTQRS